MFRIDAKQAKKSLFFASKRKQFRFRFASFRFEAKMTAHPSHHHLIEGKDKDDRLRGQDNPVEAQENPPPGGCENVEYLRGTQSR
jgi:hypothetical protein